LNKKLNILHWVTSYPDPERNDPFNAIFVQEHIKSTKNKVKTRVLFISPKSTINNFKLHECVDVTEDEIMVTRFYFNRKLNVSFLNIYIRIVLLGYFVNLISLKQFYPNIIHIHFFPAGEWATLFANIFKIKTVVTEHWTALIGYPKISSKRFGKAKHVYEKAAYILPVSTHLGNGILQNTKENITHKMQVMHNCVDIQVFKPTTEPNIPIYNIISVARLEDQNDIPTMLKAIGWTMTQEQVKQVGRMMKHSDVVISAGSTITIETAIYQTPTIVPVFHHYQPESGLIIFNYHFETHFKRLKDENLVPFVYQKEDLAPALNNALKNPSTYINQSIKLADNYIHFYDGKSTERIAALMVNLIHEA
jgi:hypothetical protein